MKLSTWITTPLLLIGGGLIGIVIAFNTPPAWEKYDIPSQQKDITEILFVDHNDPDKVQNDIVYVKTKSNDVYSISHNEWALLPELPTGEIINKIGHKAGDTDSPLVATTDKNRFYQLENANWSLINNYQEFHWSAEFDQCASTKEWRFNPPVGTDVIDSKGVVFEHTISGFFKCYVLYKDGHLEAWSHESSSFEIIGPSLLYGGIGVICGIVLSLALWLYRKFASTRKYHENK